MKEKKLKKLYNFSQDKDLATFDELSGINDKTDEVIQSNKAIEEVTNKLLEATNGVETAVKDVGVLFKDLEKNPVTRGGRFIGSFATEQDLPEIDNIDVVVGDWAFVEDSCEVWYI